MAAAQSIGEIERAFWGGRHPAWSATEKYRLSSRDTAYRHRLSLPVSAAHAADRNVLVLFQWTVEVDWTRDPLLRHAFTSKLLVDERQQAIFDKVCVDPKFAVMSRDRKREDALPEDAPVIALWRRRTHAAASHLGIELPGTFEHPERAVETFRAPNPRVENLATYAAELGCFLLDELCGMPLSRGA